MEIKMIPKEDFDQFCKIEQAAYAGSFKGTKEEREELDVIFKELTDIVLRQLVLMKVVQ